MHIQKPTSIAGKPKHSDLQPKSRFINFAPPGPISGYMFYVWGDEFRKRGKGNREKRKEKKGRKEEHLIKTRASTNKSDSSKPI